MRIIGGDFRGRNLVTPVGMDTRPTTDRVRENMFNVLQNRLEFSDIRVLDLFAGSGALGIEAISRGAAFCFFVEQTAKACKAIQTNLNAFGLENCAKIKRSDATKLGTPGLMELFDLVFADPPYSGGFGEKAAKSLVEQGWLTKNAVFVLEESRKSMPHSLPGFDAPDIRSYGDTSIGIFDVFQNSSN